MTVRRFFRTLLPLTLLSLLVLPLSLLYPSRALGQTSDRQLEADRLFLEGSQYYQSSQFQAAIQAFRAAAELYRAMGDRLNEAAAFNNLGEIYHSIGDYPAALDAYDTALTTALVAGDNRRAALVLGNMGIVYHALGQYQAELVVYEQALEIVREIGDRTGEAIILDNLSVVYRALGQPERATELHEQAAAIEAEFVQDENTNGDVTVQNPDLQQELEQLRERGDRQGEADLLGTVGVNYLAEEQYQQAIEPLQQQLQIAEEIGDRQGAAYALNNLGVAYSYLEQYGDALEVYQQSLVLRRELQDRAGESITLGNIGRILASQNQPELAIFFLKQAVNVQESIRQDLQGLSTELQASYAQTVSSTYRRLADLLLQQDRILEAQQVLDLLKVQELDEYLNDVRGNPQTNAGVEYAQQEQQLLASYEEAIAQGQELAELRAIPSDERSAAQQERLAELVANQQALTLSFDDFLNQPEVLEAIDQLSRNTRRQNLDPEQLTTLQDNLRNLNQNAVLLYPMILEDRLELILVTPYAPPIRRTVSVRREVLNQAIAQYRSDLTNRFGDARPAAQQLYQWLIEPLETDLAQAQAETILYAPDRQLRYVPLAALYDGENWLIQRFRINYITAASLTDFDSPPAGDLRILAAAFTEGEVTFEVGTRQFKFAGLPFARIEVNTIASEIPGTTEFFDEQFSPAALVPQMNDYTIVHLATHAEFVSGTPEESFILFGNGDRVTLRDITAWSLQDVDLVVLSACETAVGGELGNGEEILGFGYQIQRTGARAAIASLWAVDDGGTQVLMNRFYAALEQEGMSKAEALRQAQVALITGNYGTLTMDAVDPGLQRFLDRPYYWAPFILIGNGL